jgi:Tfp pilus assembly protein PilV
MAYKTRYSQRGFSLLEALFAIALLFMAIGTFMSLFPYALQQNQHDSYYLQAVAAGQEYLDALRNATENGKVKPAPPVVAIDAGYSVVDKTSRNSSPGNFAIDGSCDPVGQLSSLYHCWVSVTWPEAGQSRAYSTETYATQQVP